MTTLYTLKEHGNPIDVFRTLKEAEEERRTMIVYHDAKAEDLTIGKLTIAETKELEGVAT